MVRRGQATATVRQWSSLAFVVLNLLAAYVLGLAGDQAKPVAAAEMACAAVLGLASFLCFRQIHVRDDPAKLRCDFRLEVLRNVRAAVEVVIRDGRFRRYLFGCFLDGFFGMLYFPLIWAFLSTTLRFDYFQMRRADARHSRTGGFRHHGDCWVGGSTVAIRGFPGRGSDSPGESTPCCWP